MTSGMTKLYVLKGLYCILIPLGIKIYESNLYADFMENSVCPWPIRMHLHISSHYPLRAHIPWCSTFKVDIFFWKEFKNVSPYMILSEFFDMLRRYFGIIWFVLEDHGISELYLFHAATLVLMQEKHFVMHVGFKFAEKKTIKNIFNSFQFWSSWVNQQQLYM